MRKQGVTLIKYLSLFSLLLFISYSCSNDSTRDNLDEYEIRKMIEEEIRKNNQDLNYLDESGIRKIIEEVIRENNQNLGYFNESEIKKMIEEAIKKNNQDLGSLDESEIREMIEEAIEKNNQDLEFTQWEIVNVNIKESDWLWDGEARRYDAVVDLPELTEFVYENGAQLGYVYIGEQGVNEVQKMLPYVHTYSDGLDGYGNEILYTETISCDFMYGSPSTAAFYIQSSDLFRDDDILAEYEFRIVLVW